MRVLEDKKIPYCFECSINVDGTHFVAQSEIECFHLRPHLVLMIFWINHAKTQLFLMISLLYLLPFLPCISVFAMQIEKWSWVQVKSAILISHSVWNVRYHGAHYICVFFCVIQIKSLNFCMAWQERRRNNCAVITVWSSAWIDIYYVKPG